jgi:hypothetical protein
MVIAAVLTYRSMPQAPLPVVVRADQEHRLIQ